MTLLDVFSWHRTGIWALSSLRPWVCLSDVESWEGPWPHLDPASVSLWSHTWEGPLSPVPPPVAYAALLTTVRGWVGIQAHTCSRSGGPPHSCLSQSELVGGGDAFLILSFPPFSVTPCNLYPHGCSWLISVCTVASSFLRHLQEFFETSHFLRLSSQEFQIDPVSVSGISDRPSFRAGSSNFIYSLCHCSSFS